MARDPGPQDPVPPTRPTPAAILVTLLILIAAAATIALFIVPIGNPWFWPTAAVLAAAIGLGLVIPLRPR